MVCVAMSWLSNVYTVTYDEIFRFDMSGNAFFSFDWFEIFRNYSWMRKRKISIVIFACAFIWVNKVLITKKWALVYAIRNSTNNQIAYVDMLSKVFTHEDNYRCSSVWDDHFLNGRLIYF